MSTSVVLSMFAGICVGLVAAVTALVLGWGWLIAIVLYCVCGSVTLVLFAVAAVVISLRAPRDLGAAAGSTPGSVLALS